MADADRLVPNDGIDTRDGHSKNSRTQGSTGARDMWKYYKHLKDEHSTLCSKINELRTDLTTRQNSLVDTGEYFPNYNSDQDQWTGVSKSLNNQAKDMSIFEVEISTLKAKIAAVQTDIDRSRFMVLDTSKAIEDIKANKSRVAEVVSTMKEERKCLLQEIDRLKGIIARKASSQALGNNGGDKDPQRDSLDELERDHQELELQTNKLKSLYGDKCGDLVDYFIGSIEQ